VPATSTPTSEHPLPSAPVAPAAPATTTASTDIDHATAPTVEHDRRTDEATPAATAATVPAEVPAPQVVPTPSPTQPQHAHDATSPEPAMTLQPTAAAPAPVANDADSDNDTEADGDNETDAPDLTVSAHTPEPSTEAPATTPHSGTGGTHIAVPHAPSATHRTASEAAASPTQVEARTPSMRAFADDVARPSQLLPLATHGTKRMAVSIEHEQLGSIRIGAAEERGAIHISLQADDAAAGAVLREHATRLGDHLAQSGIAGAQVEVHHGDSAAHRNPRPMPDSPFPEGRTSTDDAPAARNPRQWRPTRDTNRSLDLLL
jgi:flagellar hook-length control protein FliK